MSSAKRERLLIIGVAVVVGLFVLDRYIVTPFFNASTAQSERHAALLAEHDQTSNTIRQQGAADRRWRKMDIATDAPSAQGAALRALQGFAQKSGLNLDSLKPMRQRDRDALRPLELLAGGTGTMEQVMHFCKLVEHAEIPLRIENFSLALREENGVLLRLDLRVSTLYFDKQTADRAARGARR